MKPSLFLIPAAVVAVTLAGTAVWALQDMEVSAGGEIKIPCGPNRVKLTWYWIPHYPICAGLKMGQIEICSVISNEMIINQNLERFQRPSKLMLEKNNGRSILTILLQHMNDSGTFYCSDGRRNSSFISVSVKSDNRRGMKVNPLKNSHGSKWVKLTCNSCNGQLEAQTQDSSTIVWTLNRKKASNHISVDLRITITVQDSPQNYGLWQCSNPRCRTQFDGYCLEDEFRISERLESEEMPWSTPAPLDTKKKFKILVIGGCVIGFIILLWMGVAIFVLWEKLQSRRISPSKTAKEPKSQGIQNSLGVEKPLKDQGKEKDIEMNKEAEEIQYSVLEFKETEQCQSQKKEGIPATIYAEMLASNCSES